MTAAILNYAASVCLSDLPKVETFVLNQNEEAKKWLLVSGRVKNGQVNRNGIHASQPTLEDKQCGMARQTDRISVPQANACLQSHKET